MTETDSLSTMTMRRAKFSNVILTMNSATLFRLKNLDERIGVKP